MRLSYIILSYVICFFLSACDSAKDKIKKNIEEMSSNPISIPFENMKCLTKDSLMKIAPWKHATIKLVHYVDSAQCSSCYLQKIMKHDDLFQLEKVSNYDFYNIFIVDPRTNKSSLMKLEAEYESGIIPSTIFFDTAHVFKDTNSKIPSEIMYHIFLLDESNNVIFVGNPVVNENMKDKILHIVKERLQQNK